MILLDFVKKEMPTHSSILAWKVTWTEEPGRTVHGIAESDQDSHTHTHTHTQPKVTEQIGRISTM